MVDVSRLNVQIDGDESGLVAAVNRSETALSGLGSEAARVGNQLGTASNRAKTYGTQVNKAGMHTGNLAAQFNDIGLMLASGQSPLLLAMQQGTQVNQVLGQIGTSGVARLSALRAAFLSTISPANLMTFAIIAGGAALIQYGMRAATAGRETSKLEDALEEFESIASQANRAADILSRTVEDLAEEYGDAAQRVRELALEELMLAEARATRALQERTNEVRQLAFSYRVLSEEAIAAFGAWGSGQLRQNEVSLQNIQREFGLTGDAAQELGLAFAELRAADTLADQQVALEQVRAVLEASGIELSAWPEELQEAVAAMNQLEQSAIEVGAAVNRGVEAVSGLTGAANDNGAEPVDPLAGMQKVNNDAFREQLQTRIDALRESLATEEELQLAHYARQQEALETALQFRLITQQEYDELMAESARQHADTMTEIDAYRYGTTLDAAGQFFGDMASAMSGGNEKMLKIAKAFGATEALINAWRAYNQVIADPTLPWYAKIPAAVGVLAAGMNAVSAIQGATMGSGSGGGGRGGGAASSSAASSGPQYYQDVTISLQGNNFSGDQVKDLFEKLNKGMEDGYQLRSVSVG